MTVRQLIDYITENNIPEEATIYVFAERAYDGQVATSCDLSRSDPSAYYDGMVWESYLNEDVYDEDAVAAYQEDGEITAICIYGE